MCNFYLQYLAGFISQWCVTHRTFIYPSFIACQQIFRTVWHITNILVYTVMVFFSSHYYCRMCERLQVRKNRNRKYLIATQICFRSNFWIRKLSSGLNGNQNTFFICFFFFNRNMCSCKSISRYFDVKLCLRIYIMESRNVLVLTVPLFYYMYFKNTFKKFLTGARFRYKVLWIS